VTTGRPLSHMEHHRAIADRIVADLRPVRPRWPVGARLGAWLLLDLVVAAWVVTHTRVAFAAKLRWPSYALELAIFGGAAMLAAILALRSAVPGRDPRRIEVGLLVILAVGGSLLLASTPVRSDYLLSNFVRTGLPCAYMTCLLAAGPWLGLAWAVRRAAPMHGAISGALVGAGALLFSFALMRIHCPVDEPLHLIAWHLMPVLIVIAASAFFGGRWLRFRPTAIT
jgi:hypothetical protein